jgi:hypothetical protein
MHQSILDHDAHDLLCSDLMECIWGQQGDKGEEGEGVMLLDNSDII